MAEKGQSEQPSKSRPTQQLPRSFRYVIPISLIYIAIVVVVGVTIIAYPELARDPNARRIFVRENYGNIVAVATFIAAGITVVSLSPGSAVRIAEFLLPSPIRRVLNIESFSDSQYNVRFSDISSQLRTMEARLARVAAQGHTPTARVQQIIEREKLDKELENFTKRMGDDKARLMGNSRTNLAWGVVFSIGALAVLGYPLVIGEVFSPNSWLALFGHLAPRTTLGILFALISFFFLRLYAGSEQDLKHHKNEITNFESKLIAAKLSLEVSDKKLIFEVVRGLVGTERNFILRRGERTVSGEFDDKFNEMRELILGLVKKMPGRSD